MAKSEATCLNTMALVHMIKARDLLKTQQT